MPGVSRKPGFDVPWGFGFLVLCAVLWLLQIYGFEKALRVLDGAHRNRATDFLVLTRAWRPLADIAMMVGIGVFCAARYRCNVEGVTSLVPGRWFDFLLPAALCGVLIAAMHATIHLALIGGDAFVWHLSREARVAHLFAWCLRTAVVIPVFEEFFFRGLLYSWLRRHWTCVPSVLLSSSLFALAHGWGATTLLHVPSGAIYALSYERTRALAFPIIAHGTVNLSLMLLQALMTEFGHASP